MCPGAGSWLKPHIPHPQPERPLCPWNLAREEREQPGYSDMGRGRPPSVSPSEAFLRASGSVGMLGQVARGPVGPGASVLHLWTRPAASPGLLACWAGRAPRQAWGLMVSSWANALQ